MKITPKKIVVGWAVIFALSFFLERYLEAKHSVDSIGLWYTCYVAFGYTAIVTVIGLIIFYLMQKKGRY